MITDRYYYNRLNEREKKVYNAIYDGIMRYKPYAEVPDVNLNENLVGLMYHFVLWDNPFLFTVGEYAMLHALSPNGKRIKITTLCEQTTEKALRKRLEKEVNRILSIEGLDKLSDFQKEVFVHDFVLNNVSYDHTLGNGGRLIQPYTVYGALVEHSAVCEGISKTVKLLLNMLNVKCIVVNGSFEGQPHAWNMVNIDGWAYNLDVTMDLGRVVHPGMLRYNYFNFRTGDYSSYKLNNQHLLPECKAIRNNYIVRVGGYVSSYKRLKNYISTSLKKRRKCLYLKVNRNVDGPYKNISFKDFQNEANRAYSVVVNELRINTSRFVDCTGPGNIMNIEIEYL